MSNPLNDIVVNQIYRACFKQIVQRQDREITESEKAHVINCISRFSQAHRIFANIYLPQEYDNLDKALAEEAPPSEEEEEEEESGAAGEDEEE